MSRFTTSILLATALLGVLLWIVISMVIDFARAPEEPLPLPEESVIKNFDPALPRIENRAQFTDWLNDQGLDGNKLLEAYADWLEVRGYPENYNWATANGFAADELFADNDDAELLVIAGRGDLAAMHELAERSLAADDPLEALAWYDRAIVSGSLYAMVRTSDLITTLTDPALADFITNPQWQAALNTLREETPAPRERALGWLYAAVNVGGYPLMDEAHARRILGLQTQLDPAQLESACETGQDYLLEAASARRALGNAVFTTDGPPVSVTVAVPDTVIACDVQIPPLVSLDACAKQEIVGPGPELFAVWLCTDNF